MKTIRKSKKNKGFSLVEVLLAVVILGLISTPLLQMFYSSYAMSLKAKKNLAAADLSQVVMEGISGRSYDDFTPAVEGYNAKRGLKYYYLGVSDGTWTRDRHVAPGMTGERGEAASVILNETDDGNANTDTVSYKNVEYEGYKYNVDITFTKPSTSDAYFTYNVNVKITGTDGTYYNEMKTEVPNKY